MAVCHWSYVCQCSAFSGPELGWVECALGKTRVIAEVDAKMVKPPPERPFEGSLTIHSEISPMASSEYEPGRPSDEEITITRMLDKVLRRSDSIDKESLCSLAGQRGSVNIYPPRISATRIVWAFFQRTQCTRSINSSFALAMAKMPANPEIFIHGEGMQRRRTVETSNERVRAVGT